MGGQGAAHVLRLQSAANAAHREAFGLPEMSRRDSQGRPHPLRWVRVSRTSEVE